MGYIKVKLQEIVEINNLLKLALKGGATMKMVVEDWEALQIQVALLINGETPGIPRQIKPIRGLCQRLTDTKLMIKFHFVIIIYDSCI